MMHFAIAFAAVALSVVATAQELPQCAVSSSSKARLSFHRALQTHWTSLGVAMQLLNHVSHLLEQRAV